MGFYIGQKKEHGSGWFSLWIAELSLESFFSLGTAVVVILGILAILAFVSPIFALLIYGGVAFGIVKLFRRGKKQQHSLREGDRSKDER